MGKSKTGMKTKTIFICNTCGQEHDYKQDAIDCHPDIVEKQVELIEYKPRSGELITKEKE